MCFVLFVYCFCDFCCWFMFACLLDFVGYCSCLCGLLFVAFGLF